MSETQSSKPALDSDYRTAQDSRIDDVNTPLADSTEQMTTEFVAPNAAASDTASMSSPAADTPEAGWEAAPLPGTVDIAATANIDAARENELLTLIHDLNDCNDVLLSRVSQLESALGDSQRMLQKAGEQSRAAKDKMAEQLSAEQLSVQQISQNAQQQVANVVAQLETAEQSLQRQQLMNETLQSELNNAQERVSQLEHESALGAQQHAEEAQARVQAENTIRDLRSRLQRQQRYTLQFKAALEKSLTVTARSAAASVQGGLNSRTPSVTARPTSFSEPVDMQESVSSGVTMPKAQRIMPWAGAITSPFEGIDPHLESLIRGANTPKSVPAPIALSDTGFDSSAFDQLAVASSPIAPDSEDKLWQDMERVIERSTSVADAEPLSDILAESPTIESPAEDAVDVTEVRVSTVEDADVWGDVIETAEECSTPVPESLKTTTVEAATVEADAEPKLNWQRNKAVQDTPLIDPAVDLQSAGTQSVESAVTSAHPTVNSDSTVNIEQEPLIQALGQKAPSDRAIVIDPYTVPVGQTPAAEVVFSEPSPWGKPLMEKAVAQAAVSQVDKSAGDAPEAREPSDYLPALDGEAAAANPLRTQNKIGSMSAVQLPTFETAKAGSFKR